MGELTPFLERYLRIWPPHLAAVRAFESVEMMANLAPRSPSLDLGCGDGNFTASVFKNVDVGIDNSAKEIRKASRMGTFSSLHCVDGHTIPYPDGYFKTIISNCVLEHLGRPESVIREIARVLATDGTFIFTTWTPRFNTSLLVRSEWYVRWKSNILKHRSIKSVEQWEEILKKHGLRIVLTRQYLSPASLKFLDLLELVSLIGLWKLDIFHLYSFAAPALPGIIIRKMARSLEAHIRKTEAFKDGCAVIVKARK
ncbi:MAG: class I SAM-dependent methyltransferase [Acidobacteriota bacterium]